MPDRSGQSAVIAFLADPATHGGAPVERFDTHGAVVVAAGDRALKLKRAVAFPYMDFSTLERRERACRAEVAINRRTAPELYLGLAAVIRTAAGELRLGEPIGPAEDPAADVGEILDWVVVMRRFDQSALFDRLARSGALTPELIERLAEALAALHQGAERRAGGDAAAALRWVVDENLAEFQERPGLFPAGRVARLEALSRAALDRAGPLLDRRGEAGQVRRCHGDLHLGNVVLIDGRPTLFDAIEFNDSLAVIDVLYDLAFLLLDLFHQGLGGLANRALNRYLEITGDIEGLAAMPLFLSTRAAVRAKVGASIAEAQADPAAAARQRSIALAYFDAALTLLGPPPARLVAIGGLSGTGKTVAARGLAPDLGAAPGAVILRSDVIRKQLWGVAEQERLPPQAYRREVTARVYDELMRRTARVLATGHAAIADAVFADPAERGAIAQVAHAAGIPFAGLWLSALETVLKQRVAARAAAAGRRDASDADAAVVAMQQGFTLGALDWQRIDAGGPLAATLAAARAALAASG